MRKSVIMSVILLAFILIPGAGQAEVRSGSYSLTPFIGGYAFDSDQNLEDRPVYGIRAGYSFTPNWGVEALFDYVNTKADNGAGGADVVGYRLEALYHFLPGGKLVPFLAVGAGGATINAPAGFQDGTDPAVDYGLGLKYFITENWAVRGDVRHVMVFDDTWNNLEYTLGLSYVFGGEKPTPTITIYDSDRDGVPDNKDRCPDTPEGVKVDRDGCPLDSDGDGVPDYLDKCPGTPLGVKGDSEGCPLDSDRDGVHDYLDKCPDTPYGTPVDKDGCPPVMEEALKSAAQEEAVVRMDSDGDGVPDDLDKCPGTPAGIMVDRDGCPLDSDKDGVYDYLDKCPGTPVGVNVDKDGCPLDSDRDGVLDYLDKCPDTPLGNRVDKDGCPIPEKVTIALNVEFDTAKADIKQKYHEEIKKFADFMNRYPGTKATIEGHTDNVGKAEYNRALSQKRADSVRQYLSEKFNISPERLNAVGHGETQPVYDNGTAEGRQKNRRVQAVIETMVVK